MLEIRVLVYVSREYHRAMLISSGTLYAAQMGITRKQHSPNSIHVNTALKVAIATNQTLHQPVRCCSWS